MDSALMCALRARLDGALAELPAVVAQDAADQALASDAAQAGQLLQTAWDRGDREAAKVWMDAMYALVRLRRVRHGVSVSAADAAVNGRG